jgi:hypothetical protein
LLKEASGLEGSRVKRQRGGLTSACLLGGAWVTGSSEGVKSVFSNGCLTAVDIANAIDQVDCERADARASRTGL